MVVTCVTYEGDGEGHDGVHEDSELQLTKYIFVKKIFLLFICDKPVYICWLSATQEFYLHQKVILNKVFYSNYFSTFNNNLCRCWEIFS